MIRREFHCQVVRDKMLVQKRWLHLIIKIKHDQFYNTVSMRDFNGIRVRISKEAVNMLHSIFIYQIKTQIFKQILFVGRIAVIDESSSNCGRNRIFFF